MGKDKCEVCGDLLVFRGTTWVCLRCSSNDNQVSAPNLSTFFPQGGSV